MIYSLLMFESPIPELLAWLRTILRPDDILNITAQGHTKRIRFQFPLLPGNAYEELGDTYAGKETFRIRDAADKKGRPDDTHAWVCIFANTKVVVYESLSRAKKHLLRPLRYGFSDQEMRDLTNIARNVLIKKLSQQEVSEKTFPYMHRFHLPCAVGVALWVDGALRGSQIVERVPLGKGIARAALRSLSDQRFHPLTQSDLSQVRIQISVILGPMLPYESHTIRSNTIDPFLGYKLTHGKRTGWYLPEIFNLKRFRTEQEFINSLAVHKAHITLPHENAFTVLSMPVIDLLEAAPQENRTLRLIGPVAEKRFSEKLPLKELVSEIAFPAAAWLERTQRSDGSFPLFINPKNGESSEENLPRTFLAANAMVRFGKSAAHGAYIQAAEKSYTYGLTRTRSHTAEIPLIAWIYLGQTAYELGDQETYKRITKRVANTIEKTSFEPIVHAQACSLFLLGNTDSVDSDLHRLCSAIALKLRDACTIPKNDTHPQYSLARVAECIPVLEKTGHSAEAQATLRLFLESQCTNGSFPNSFDEPYPQTAYTRGTSKILEVISLYPDTCHSAIRKTLQWLACMQYTEDSSFFVPTGHRQKIAGSFRHDYFEPNAWIDTNAHLLIGASRILNNTTPYA